MFAQQKLRELLAAATHLTGLMRSVPLQTGFREGGFDPARRPAGGANHEADWWCGDYPPLGRSATETRHCSSRQR